MNLGVAAFVFTLGLLAAGVVAYAGIQMVNLRSVAGNTVAEAYYQAVGYLSLGFSIFIVFLSFALGFLIERAPPFKRRGQKRDMTEMG